MDISDIDPKKSPPSGRGFIISIDRVSRMLVRLLYYLDQ